MSRLLINSDWDFCQAKGRPPPQMFIELFVTSWQTVGIIDVRYVSKCCCKVVPAATFRTSSSNFISSLER